jgi:hypothetical protein
MGRIIMKWLLLLVLSLALMGCSIVQNATPSSTQLKEICVIANPKVSQPEFIEVYQKELGAKGFEVKLLTADSTISTCPLTTTYAANWAWDLALYMVYAEMKVYEDGKPAGEAIYDARKGGANMSKFIKANEKIKEMVNLVFPKGAGKN